MDNAEPMATEFVTFVRVGVAVPKRESWALALVIVIMFFRFRKVLSLKAR